MDIVKHYGCYDYNEEWYLIELMLDLPASEIRWSDIYIPEQGIKKEDWQVPYLEQYLNVHGTEKLCELYETPGDAKPCRVAFFLYKVPASTLSTPYGDFELRTDTEVPKRLARIIKFE